MRMRANVRCKTNFFDALPEMFLVHSLKCRIRTNIDEEGQELPIIGVGVFDISFVVNSL